MVLDGVDDGFEVEVLLDVVFVDEETVLDVLVALVEDEVLEDAAVVEVVVVVQGGRLTECL